MTPAARKCSIHNSVWSLYLWYLKPWVCLFAHANLAKLLFMELLRQTVFVLTNEHKWEKKLWNFDVNHLLHTQLASWQKTRIALGFTEFTMLFLKCCLQNQVPYSDMKIQTWSIDFFLRKMRFCPLCQELNHKNSSEILSLSLFFSLLFVFLLRLAVSLLQMRTVAALPSYSFHWKMNVVFLQWSPYD